MTTLEDKYIDIIILAKGAEVKFMETTRPIYMWWAGNRVQSVSRGEYKLGNNKNPYENIVNSDNNKAN